MSRQAMAFGTSAKSFRLGCVPLAYTAHLRYSDILGIFCDLYHTRRWNRSRDDYQTGGSLPGSRKRTSSTHPNHLVLDKRPVLTRLLEQVQGGHKRPTRPDRTHRMGSRAGRLDAHRRSHSGPYLDSYTYSLVGSSTKRKIGAH